MTVERRTTLPLTSTIVTLTERAGGGTVMAVESTFPGSIEAMEQLLSMGMEEGFTAAIGQIPGILAEQVTPGR